MGVLAPCLSLPLHYHRLDGWFSRLVRRCANEDIPEVCWRIHCPTSRWTQLVDTACSNRRYDMKRGLLGNKSLRTYSINGRTNSVFIIGTLPNTNTWSFFFMSVLLELLQASIEQRQEREREVAAGSFTGSAISLSLLQIRLDLSSDFLLE